MKKTELRRRGSDLLNRIVLKPLSGGWPLNLCSHTGTNWPLEGATSLSLSAVTSGVSASAWGDHSAAGRPEPRLGNWR